MKFSKILLSTLAVVMAFATPVFAVDTARTYTSGILVLAFVGVCALIVVAQLLPAIRTLLDTMKSSAREARKEKLVQPAQLKK